MAGQGRSSLELWTASKRGKQRRLELKKGMSAALQGSKNKHMRNPVCVRSYTQTCVGESHGNVCSCRSVDISVDIYMQMRESKYFVSASCRMCCHILSICVVSCLQVPHSKLLQHKINTSAMTPMSIRVQH